MRAAYALLCVALCGCEGGAPAIGDAQKGKLLLRQFGCGNCHRIEGVAGVAATEGAAGPPLAGVGKRTYLAGGVPNSPQNMARWIREPQAHKPGTTMPAMGATEAQARDMVAYLQGLK